MILQHLLHFDCVHPLPGLEPAIALELICSVPSNNLECAGFLEVSHALWSTICDNLLDAFQWNALLLLWLP